MLLLLLVGWLFLQRAELNSNINKIKLHSCYLHGWHSGACSCRSKPLGGYVGRRINVNAILTSEGRSSWPIFHLQDSLQHSLPLLPLPPPLFHLLSISVSSGYGSDSDSDCNVQMQKRQLAIWLLQLERQNQSSLSLNCANWLGSGSAQAGVRAVPVCQAISTCYLRNAIRVDTYPSGQ